MSFTDRLLVLYHQQDNNFYCGPACLQMVLNSMGTPVEHLSQDILYADANSHSIADPGAAWFSAPDGMLWTIDHWNPTPTTHFFILHQEDTEESISRKIVSTIKFFKVAPIALVKDMQHWVVVTGYTVSSEPVGFDDVSYFIMGFFVNDPAPPLLISSSGAAPPPHWAFDPCGFGDVTVFGQANQYIGYDEWATTYMTAVTDGFWQRKFLAICDPKPASKKHGNKMPVKRLFNGEKIISKKNAGECALLGMKEHGLMENERLRDILSDVYPHQEPVLVESLNRPNDFYYIVPMMSKKAEHIHALVCVHALFGNFRQASFAAENKPILFNLLSREKILDILGKRFELKEEDKVLIIHPELISIYPALVWRPCRESLSPYVPFYMITINQYKLFIRLDGKVFARLNIDGRGL